MKRCAFLLLVGLAALALSIDLGGRAVRHLRAARPVRADAAHARRPAEAGPPAAGEPLLGGRNLFCSRCADRPPALAALPPSWRLVVTAVAREPARSLAVVCGPKGCGALAAGDRAAEAVVLAVGETAIELERAGRRMRLGFLRDAPPSGPAPAPALASGVRALGPSSFALSPALRDHLLDNPQLLSRVRATPQLEGGRLAGFALEPGGPARPLFAALGLQPGDVVRAVDGEPLSGADALVRLYARLRHQTHLELSLLRGGRPLTLDYTVR